jgi:hypothetical protein
MKKKSNTWLVILINIIAFIVVELLLMILLRGVHIAFNVPSKVLSLIILASCPIIWGTVIFMIVKKKTPGHLIAAKINNKNNK